MPAAPLRSKQVRPLVSVGYEGREIDEFVRDLKLRGVTVVADVRLNAVSRRRGFSKSALAHALLQAGIQYVHLRGLGNPRDNRRAFSGADLERGRNAFRELLDSESAANDLERLRELTGTTVVAVLCVEREEQKCHRQLIIDALMADA